jgi:Flp pilus assembly pilin Flp
MWVGIVRRFWSNDQGLETVEYAVIVGLIVAAVIATIAAIGIWVAGTYTTFKTNVGA